MPTKPGPDQRQIVLDGQAVSYQLRRSTRRTIGLAIDHRGLRVGAPNRASIRDIEILLQQHARWVLDKLSAWHDRPKPPTLDVRDGTTLSLLGEPLTVALSPLGRARWQFGPQTLYLNPGTAHEPAALLEKALRERAREVFGERLAAYAAKLGVATPPLRLSSARTRWGSCNSQGAIALN